MNVKGQYNWNFISLNRNVIYSFSIIWIVIYHSTSIESGGLYLLNQLKTMGTVGVDVFLLVSGISLYFSFSKNENIRTFYKRRMTRILLPVCIVGIPYFFLRDVVLYKAGIVTFLLNFTGLSLFTDHIKTTWFVTAIIAFYLLYPLLYRFFKKVNWKARYLFLVLSAIIGIYAIVRILFPDFWHNSEILFRRFPIFVIGTFFGKYVHDKKETNLSHGVVILLGVAAIVTYLVLGMFESKITSIIPYRYILSFFSIPITMMFSLLPDAGVIKKISSVIAPITFEMYLLNEKCNNMIGRVLKLDGAWLLLLHNTIVIILTVGLAFVLLNIENLLKKRIRWLSN